MSLELLFIWENIPYNLINFGKYLFGTRSDLGNVLFGIWPTWEIIFWVLIHLGKYPTAHWEPGF